MTDDRAVIEVAVNRENTPEVVGELRSVIDEDDGEELAVPEEFLYNEDWFYDDVIADEADRLEDQWNGETPEYVMDHIVESVDYRTNQMTLRQMRAIIDLFGLDEQSVHVEADTMAEMASSLVHRHIEHRLREELVDRGYDL